MFTPSANWVSTTQDTASGEIEQKCPFPDCGKSFKSRWSMTRHIRTHTGDKPHKCSLAGCDKNFVQKCSLRRHEQTHSQDKPWACDRPYCTKRFKLKEYLDVHKRAHIMQDQNEHERTVEHVMLPSNLMQGGVANGGMMYCASQPPSFGQPPSAQMIPQPGTLMNMNMSYNTQKRSFDGFDASMPLNNNEQDRNVRAKSTPQELAAATSQQNMYPNPMDMAAVINTLDLPNMNDIPFCLPISTTPNDNKQTHHHHIPMPPPQQHQKFPMQQLGNQAAQGQIGNQTQNPMTVGSDPHSMQGHQGVPQQPQPQDQQQQEMVLMSNLTDCTSALNRSITLLTMFGVQNIPSSIVQTSNRCSALTGLSSPLTAIRPQQPQQMQHPHQQQSHQPQQQVDGSLTGPHQQINPQQHDQSSLMPTPPVPLFTNSMDPFQAQDTTGPGTVSHGMQPI